MQQSNNNQVKVKDLPLYSQNDTNKTVYVALVKEKNDFEQVISDARKFVFDTIDLFSEQRDRVVQFYETGVAHTRSSLDYVRSETNVLPKLGVITVSGLAGILLGIRRSNFRRFIYSTTLMSASTALCYPNEAKYYGNVAFDWSKTNAKNVYHDYIMPKIGKDDLNNNNNQLRKVNQSSKDKVVTIDASKLPSDNLDFGEDKGQSKDEDKDLYTTRK